jgi:murein DD-endopeptidase MepM/ murein hydrolase activator NlpD
MHRFLLSILLFLPFTFTCLFGQELPQSRSYTQNQFRFPLDIVPTSSGTFGELRANHFHSGLDFRTNQKTGYPVYAVFDGYVSRLRVQFGGFGNAVYISHPNGYTSVYAHLERFTPEMAKIIKDQQYKIESDFVDFELQPLQIPVKKGQVIAWSGNTGSSAGPHLHFEIRDTKTEETINPQLFGLKIPDNIPPSITGIYLYQLNGTPFNENTSKKYFQVTGAAGKYKLTTAAPVQVNGEVGFGISTNDTNTGSTNRNGIYSIELKKDGVTVYAFKAESFTFDMTRALNAHIDYPAYLTSKRWIHKSFVEPGNRLKMYPQIVNQGLINFDEEGEHDMEYIVKDASGNTSTLLFKVKSSKVVKNTKTESGVLFKHNQTNEFSNEQVKIVIPEGNLYSDIYFNYAVLPKNPGAVSAIHKIHNRFTPLHENFQLWIKPDSVLGALADKAVIVSTNKASQGGTYQDGYIRANIRNFGDYYIALDTIPPVIQPINISEGKNMSQISRITIKASDNLSGIKSYAARIDGKWVLMTLDYKTRLMNYVFDERVQPGKHVFELVVIDHKNNQSKFTANFYR